MSNFTERLTELMEHDDHGCCSTEFIKKYAPAIRDLVVAADTFLKDPRNNTMLALHNALAKLDEA